MSTLIMWAVLIQHCFRWIKHESTSFTLTRSPLRRSRPLFTGHPADIQEQMMKGQEGKKTAKKEPAKTMKEKKADKKVKKEEKQRQ